MKALMFVGAFLFSGMVMAAEGRQVVCFNHSDSDYELILVANSNGMPGKAALNNADWGAAGNGALQDLATRGEFGDGVFSDFLVISKVEPTLGLESGTRLHISYSGDKIEGVTLMPENPKQVGVQFDSYSCTE